jgi:hypothetical protein
MRSTTFTAIATCSLGFLGFPTLAVGASVPGTKDVIVEIKLSPLAHPPTPGVTGTPTTPLNPAPKSPTESRFPSFNSDQLDRQLQRYIAYVEQKGTPDILIVGSSRALQGVNPLALQQTLQQQGYGEQKVFNFGINGATAQVVDWLLHQLLSANHLPRLLIWADGSRAFNSGRIDHTFNKIKASAGHRQLLAGKRPLNSASSGLKLGQVCIDLLPQPLSSANSSANSLTGNSPSGFNPKPRSTFACRQPIKIVVRPVSASSEQPNFNQLEALGFQVVNTQFSPNQYFQRYPRVSGAFDADYRNFNLNGPQTAALENVTRFANTHQIPLILVNLPLTATHLDRTRRLREEQFRQQMRRTARLSRFTFIDLSTEESLMQNRYFADPSHLNRDGAVAVAQALGNQLGRLGTSWLQQRQSRSPDTSSQMANNQYTTYLILRIDSGHINHSNGKTLKRNTPSL